MKQIFWSGYFIGAVVGIFSSIFSRMVFGGA